MKLAADDAQSLGWRVKREGGRPRMPAVTKPVRIVAWRY
jgi:hypothetical protein